MVDRSLAQSPLAPLHIDGRVAAADPEPGVRLQERRFPMLLNLRLGEGDIAALAAIEAALGGILPRTPNTTGAIVGGATVFWLGPDEFMVAGDDGNVDLERGLRAAAEGHHVALVDVSDGRAVIRIVGARARDVLEKGCSLDLHDRVFAPGRCAQSGLAQASILLHRIADPAANETAWDIYVDRSFAGYLWMWLEDAAREFGLAVDLSA